MKTAGEVATEATAQTTTVEADRGRIYIPDRLLPPAWIVDVDGTVALMDERGPFDWSLVGSDLPNRPVIDVVEALACDEFHLIFLSGRSDVCREATTAWLRQHIHAGHNARTLLMRREGDFRPDATIKEEIFWRDVAPNWDVQGAIDDRDVVVAMWRRIGLTCLQVAPGDF